MFHPCLIAGLLVWNVKKHGMIEFLEKMRKIYSESYGRDCGKRSEGLPLLEQK